MTTQQLKDLINSTIAGQGNQIDIGGGLGTILTELLDKIDAQSNEIEAQNTVLDSLIYDITELATQGPEISIGEELYNKITTVPLLKYHECYLCAIPYPFFNSTQKQPNMNEYLNQIDIYDNSGLFAWASVRGKDNNGATTNQDGLLAIASIYNADEFYLWFIES